MNTFDLTIKNNLHVGLTNAINQIKHLENFLSIMNGKGAIPESNKIIITQLTNLQEMLSLIEPEGLPTFDLPKETVDAAMSNNIPETIALSEASRHNFQQAVPEEFIDQESDVQPELIIQ